MNKYSENEIKLFGHFGYYALNKNSSKLRNLHTLVKEACLICFADERSYDPEAVEALRRGYIWLFYKDQAGGTPEWNEVISW